MWLVSIVLFVSFSRQPWVLASTNFTQGSSCNTTIGSGICTGLRQCESAATIQVEPANLFTCGFSGTERLICCPTTTPTTPAPVQLTWEILRTEEPSSTIPTNALEDGSSIHHSGEESSCNSPAGTGVCKPIHLCQPYRDKTVKYAELTRCSFIGFDEIVCCPTVTQAQGNSTTQSPPGEDIRSRFKMRPSVLACQRYHDTARTTFHISGGRKASLGEFPYVGAVLYPSQQAGRQYDVGCGTSLISERFALTAAHCVVKEPTTVVESPELVRFGSVEWNPKDNLTYRFDAKIKNITAHELYRTNSYYHDIAVIEFTEPVPTSILISPICLHAKTDDIDSSVHLQIVGWGVTSMFSNAKSEELQRTEVNTVSLIECNSTHIDYGVSVRYSQGLIDGQYCALDKDFRKDSCSGDSGGPLVLALDDWEELVGIVSFGKGCGSIVPSIYTRVAHYLEWIEGIVWPSTDDA